MKKTLQAVFQLGFYDYIKTLLLVILLSAFLLTFNEPSFFLTCYSFPKEISRHIVSCLNNMSWYKGEMLKSGFEEDEHWYKFKFHWYLTSKIHYVDIRNGTMYCR